MADIHIMNINDLDLNLLRVFSALAQERSVTRAADRLNLSQPAVSNALKRLRTAFGDDLFVRGQGGMAPTTTAQALSEPIADALKRIEAALVGGPEIEPSRIAEPITITCADEEILLHAADILDALDRAGCRAPVQFAPLSTDYGAHALWRSRLALTITTILYAPDGLRQRKVYDEDLVCLARADRFAAGAFDFDAYLAAEHLLIAPLGGAPQGYIDQWLTREGKKRTIRLVSHTFGSAHSLVRETGLIATIPRRRAARSPYGDDLVVLPVPFEAPGFSLHIFWSERYDDDPLAKWLRDLVWTAMRRPDRLARA
ncbi:MAG: LysR family transcriptional regulator [Pseudomonadota bacterium]